MSTHRSAALLGALALGSIVLDAALDPARAQPIADQLLSPFVLFSDRERGANILQRPRTEYDALGVRSGEFLIRPHLEESVGYDSNVLGTRPSRGSFFVGSAPQVDILSDFASRNALRASFGLANQEYVSQPRQSLTNWNASLAGDYHLGQDVLSASASETYQHQTPVGLDDTGLSQPLGYKATDVQVRYATDFFRWHFEPNAEYIGYRFDPTTLPGATITEKALDRDTYVAGLTTRFGKIPERSLVLMVRAADTRYFASQGGAPRPDSRAYEVLLGTDYLISGNLQVLLLGGYEVRQFTNAAYSSRSDFVGQVSVVWTPTGLTTVVLRGSRSVDDAIGVSAVGVTDTLARLTVDHEYRRNVLLQGRALVDHAEYGQGGGHQTLFGLGSSATYLFNRNLRVTTSYDFTERTGGTPGQISVQLTPGSALTGFGNYNRHVALVSFGFAL